VQVLEQLLERAQSLCVQNNPGSRILNALEQWFSCPGGGEPPNCFLNPPTPSFFYEICLGLQPSQLLTQVIRSKHDIHILKMDIFITLSLIINVQVTTLSVWWNWNVCICRAITWLHIVLTHLHYPHFCVFPFVLYTAPIRLDHKGLLSLQNSNWLVCIFLRVLHFVLFTARCYASAVLAMGTGVSPGTLVFWRQRSPRNSTGITPCWGAKCRWGWSKSATFDKLPAISRKRYKIDT